MADKELERLRKKLKEREEKVKQEEFRRKEKQKKKDEGYHGFFSFSKSKNIEQKIIYKYINPDLTEVKDFDKKKFYYEAKPRDYFRSRSFLRRYLDKKLKRKKPEKVVLIRMELNNGQYKEFLTAEEKEGFMYRGGKYIIDLDARYFVIDSNMFAYDYHESIAFPIKKRIPVNDIKATLEHSGITEVENAINPITLERFIKSEIAQGILQGAAIGKLFKVMLILMIIVLILTAFDFLIDLFASGLLEQLIPKK